MGVGTVIYCCVGEGLLPHRGAGSCELSTPCLIFASVPLFYTIYIKGASGFLALRKVVGKNCGWGLTSGRCRAIIICNRTCKVWPSVRRRIFVLMCLNDLFIVGHLLPEYRLILTAMFHFCGGSCCFMSLCSGFCFAHMWAYFGPDRQSKKHI